MDLKSTADSIAVSVRLPSHDFIDLNVCRGVSIREILTALESHQIGVKAGKITLLYQSNVMLPSSSLSEFIADNSTKISMDALIDSIDDCDLTYDDFIEDISLSTSDQSLDHVSVDAYFTIRFKDSSTGLSLHLPALQDCGCMRSTSGDCSPSASRMVEVLGKEEAARRGYVQWATAEEGGALVPGGRVHLLEVSDPTLMEDPSRCLYSSTSSLNAGYSLGDGSSWQRYTRSHPLACELHCDTDSSLLRVLPLKPLLADTLHALLLQNGTPCPPESELGGPLLGFGHCPGVGDDKLLFFRTEKEAPC